MAPPGKDRARANDDQGDGSDSEMKELAEKIERLETTISDMARPYRESMELMDRFREMTANYLRIIGLVQKYGRLSPDLLVPDIKDPIARDILVILFEKPGQNVSQIAEALRASRGSGSRKTVRDKLAELQEAGAVVAEDEGKTRVFRPSDMLVDRWLKLLGVMR